MAHHPQTKAKAEAKRKPPFVSSLNTIIIIAMGLLLNACATAVFPGETESVVLSKLGQPAGRYQVNQEQWLEYPTGPRGQQTYFAYFDSDGKLKSYEQVLNSAKFATIAINQADKEQVLRTIGRPAEKSYLALSKLEVWSYRYKEADIWNSLMHVHFDSNGIVRKMENGPDRMYEGEREGFGR
jgi:hypothetical protein